MTCPNHDHDNPPGSIASSEVLGRGVFGSRARDRAAKGRVPTSVFFQPGTVELSVDRLTHAPPEKAAQLGEVRAEKRGATFYGWATIVASGVTEAGLEVVASPLPDGTNPYHADIVLPSSVVDCEAEAKTHAGDLAERSKWKPRPSP